MKRRKVAICAISFLAFSCFFAFQNLTYLNYFNYPNQTYLNYFNYQNQFFAAATAPQLSDLNILNSNYALIDSKTITYSGSATSIAPPANGGTTTINDRSLTTTFSKYLEYNSGDIQSDDLFIIMSQIEMSHQSPSKLPTTATMSAYLTCNGTQSSPTISKSLKRYYGNHHGSMIITGACKVQPNSKSNLSIQLMAKSNLLHGLIHGGQQSQMIINHYRLYSKIANTSLVYAPKELLNEIQQTSDLIVNRDATNAKEKSLFQSLKTLIKKGDYVYLSSQATAKDAVGAIPMFGYEIYAGSSRAAYATENVVADGVPRIGQNLVAMFKANNQINEVSTKVIPYRSDGRSTGLTFEANHSRLSAMIFENGLDARSMFLKNVLMSSTKTANVITKGALTELHDPIKVTFRNSGLVNIQASATLVSNSLALNSCGIRIAIKGAAGENYSVPSVRNFKSPYDTSALNTELLFNVPSAGEYTVRTIGTCNASAANVGAGNASILIQAYEPN